MMMGTVRSPGGTLRLVAIQQLSPRSTTAVDTNSGGAGCPFNVTGTEEDLGSVRPMNELDGPIGWPIVGNFLTYLKKENQGKMHEVQVSSNFTTQILKNVVLYVVTFKQNLITQ